MNGTSKEGAKRLKEKTPALQTANRMIPCFQNDISSNPIAVISSGMISSSRLRVYGNRVDRVLFLCDAEKNKCSLYHQ